MSVLRFAIKILLKFSLLSISILLLLLFSSPNLLIESLSNEKPSNVSVPGRKNGASSGFFAGSIGLFRSLIKFNCGKFAHLDDGKPESVIKFKF